MKKEQKETPIPSRMRGRGVGIGEAYFLLGKISNFFKSAVNTVVTSTLEL